MVREECGACGGGGRVRVRREVILSVPAGVASGSALRVRGEGDAGPRGGPPGDLYVLVTVREHPSIRRQGLDLFSTVSLDYTDAILGTTVKVRRGLPLQRIARWVQSQSEGLWIAILNTPPISACA